MSGLSKQSGTFFFRFAFPNRYNRRLNNKKMRPEIKTTSDSDLESVFSIEEPKTSGSQPTALKYICRFSGCGQAFRRMAQLDRHEYKHTGIRKHACIHEGCSKTYTNITHLRRHLKVFHEKSEKTKDIKCRFDFCDKMFCSTYSMERHIREVHQNPKVYNCTHCDQKFTQKIKLRRHEVKHTGVYPYVCAKCSKGFVQEYFLQRHICKVYTCDQCNTNFEKWSILMAHRKTTNHKTTLYRCTTCNQTFSSIFNYTEHENCHIEDKEVFKCPHADCTRFYSYKRNLNEHIRVAHEGKKFPCTIDGCGVVLTSKRALENHIKVIHSKKQKKCKRPKKQRSKRKDIGQRRQSTLSKLSGVLIEKDLDKMVMEGTAEIEIDLPAIVEEIENPRSKTDDDDIEDNHLVVLKAK